MFIDISQIPLYQLILILLLIITFICQIAYSVYYSTIAKYKPLTQSKPEPVSVIVVVGRDAQYIEQGLPMLLEQEYPEFEVVVVNDCGGTDIDIELRKLARAYKNLRFTTIKRDELFNHSRKIPLNLGIKAARYENVIITDTNAHPTTEWWLATMCQGFEGADLVIGYTGMDVEKGVAKKYIRCSRFASSIRFLSAAIAQRPYKGIYNNIGFKKELYFSHRGYTHLRMTVGEDDLYVQRVAKHSAPQVVVAQKATMRQSYGGGMRWWWNEQKYRSYAFRYYPKSVKIRTFVDLFTRALFFKSAFSIAILALMGLIENYYVWIGTALLVLLRELILLLIIKKIAHKLCEIKIIWSYLLYDFVAPYAEALLAICRRISPPRTLWVQNSK